MEDATTLASVIATSSVLTLGLVQAEKAMDLVTSRWAPVAALITGVLVCFLISFTSLVEGFTFADDWALALIAGLTSGLTAAGLYSGGKKLVEGSSS